MTPIEILEAMQGKHIAVLGDPMVDEYIFGRVDRICPEAPVPVFIPERIERRPGGASNAAKQLDALGCFVHSLMPQNVSVKTQNVSVKTRYVAGHHLLLRVDQDVTYRPDSHDVTFVGQNISLQRQLDAVVLSDYDKGWLSAAMVHEVIESAKARNAPVIVDPKNNIYRFSGCSLLCPTQEEFGSELADRSLFPAMLVKRGAQGLRLFQGDELHDIPAVARKVYDVTGAGDVVVAVVAAAVAAGASYLEAAQLAALAAGFVVGEVGTTVCPLEKLKELVNAG